MDINCDNKDLEYGYVFKKFKDFYKNANKEYKKATKEIFEKINNYEHDKELLVQRLLGYVKHLIIAKKLIQCVNVRANDSYLRRTNFILVPKKTLFADISDTYQDMVIRNIHETFVYEFYDYDYRIADNFIDIVEEIDWSDWLDTLE